MRIMLLVLFLAGTWGCSFAPQTRGDAPPAATVKQDIQDASAPKKHKPERLVTKPQRKWSFNGEEFIVQERKVVVGANVYNVTLSQYGVIQEDVYVTLKPTASATSLLEVLKGVKLKSQSKSGKSIFRLTFHQKAEIYSIYKRLLSTEGVASVEISVFYHGVQKDEM